MRLSAKDSFWAAPQNWASLITSEDIRPSVPYTARPVKIKDGVAIIDISGVILREEDDFCEYFGGASTVRISRQITEACNDDSIKSILLNINSPGGQVNGTAELADQIYAARSKKPVFAYIAGDGYSAGYWLASQAQKIFMHEAAGAGALGVCYPVELPFEGEERTVWMVSNISPKKNPEVNNTEAAAQMQVFLNDLGMIFVRAVARGRGVQENDVLTNYGQGDIFIAAKAVSAGLADQVTSFEQALFYSKSPQGEPAGDAISQSEESMAETKTPGAEMIDSNEITLDWLKSNMPDLVEQIRNEGADAETERQTELDAMEPADEEEKMAIKAARGDRKITAAKLALSMRLSHQAKEQARIKAEADARARDNEQVIIPTETQAPAAQTNDDKVIAAMRKKRQLA